jgi:hypothetical protein
VASTLPRYSGRATLSNVMSEPAIEQRRAGHCLVGLISRTGRLKPARRPARVIETESGEGQRLSAKLFTGPVDDRSTNPEAAAAGGAT